MKKGKKILNLIMAGVISFIPLNALALTKNESVYTTLNTDGTVNKLTVTNHLLINDEKEIEDNSELSEILNINGEETFTKDNNTLKWTANGKDIFYQGKTTKDLPLDINIKYYLNDKEENVKDMVGKDGNVKIVITFTNNLKNTVNINGKNEEIYTPFVVMVGTMLDGKVNSHIEVTNGKVVDTGSKSAIVSIASPGLYESLNINELNNMNKVEINYTTTKFSLGNIYILATPKLIEKEDIEIFDEVDSLTNSINTLQTSMNTIEDGAKQLESASVTLKNGASEISTNLQNVLTAVENLQNGSYSVKEGLQRVLASVKQAKESLANSDASDSITKLNTLKSKNSLAINSLLNQTGMDYETLVSNANLDEQLQSTLNLINLLYANNSAIDETLNTLSETSNNLNTLLTSLETALNTLDNGETQIYNGLTTLKDGVNKLYSGSNSLVQGANKLNSGVSTLSTGISTFNNEGINTLSSYSNKVKSYSNKIEALTDLSKNYNGFTSNNSTNTIFINKVSSAK